jgi:hypothetical protein
MVHWCVLVALLVPLDPVSPPLTPQPPIPPGARGREEGLTPQPVPLTPQPVPLTPQPPLPPGERGREERAPREVILRAIEAHGGMKRLSQARADRVRLQGTLYVGKEGVPFTAQTTVQLPGQYKNEMKMTVAGRTHTIVQVLDGGTARVWHNGVLRNLPAQAAAEIQATLRLHRAIRLVPLLHDSSFRLRLLEPTTLQGRTILGVEVKEGTRSLNLYFDQQTGLLTKSEHRLASAGDQMVLQEHYYGDFKDLGGYLRPTRVVAFRNGRKLLEAQLIDVKYFTRIDPREFQGP